MILTTMDFVTLGLKGGFAMTGLRSVSWKHFPHAGPVSRDEKQKKARLRGYLP